MKEEEYLILMKRLMVYSICGRIGGKMMRRQAENRNRNRNRDRFLFALHKKE